MWLDFQWEGSHYNKQNILHTLFSSDSFQDENICVKYFIRSLRTLLCQQHLYNVYHIMLQCNAVCHEIINIYNLLMCWVLWGAKATEFLLFIIAVAKEITILDFPINNSNYEVETLLFLISRDTTLVYMWKWTSVVLHYFFT